MARNEEKHYGRLNRLYLLKEKEEYEKANPKRPRLDVLYTAEEVQKWLPSIKKDIDFYLKKSQVTCYSDAHVEECRDKVVKLEKEFKAFVRKFKQLSPAPIDAIPWTNRPYKRKHSGTTEEHTCKQNDDFIPIPTPILDEKVISNSVTLLDMSVNCTIMDKPLSFSSKTENNVQCVSELHSERVNTNSSDMQCCINDSSETKNSEKEDKNHKFVSCHEENIIVSIVDYDSSDNENS